SPETILQFEKKIELQKSIEKASHFFSAMENRQGSPKSKLLCVIGVLSPFFETWEDEKFEDEAFKAKLQQLIKPIHPIPALPLPKECVTVAIHVRTGVGYDWQLNIDNMPTKFPADSFYLNGLKAISKHFYDRSLYVQIFSDDPNPPSIRD